MIGKSVTLRASERFELKRVDELTSSQRESLRDLENDDDYAGLLVPREAGTAGIKAVDRDGAALFCSLAAPAAMESVDDEVIDLVLDGVLEIEKDGEFLWGADALPLLCVAPTCDDDSRPAGKLSIDALRHAADLESADPEMLTAALYFYNRIPISAFWRSRFAAPDAVIAHLGADRGPLRALLERSWVTSPGPGWLTWRQRHARAGHDAPTYKLYISPRPENIAEAFDIVVRTFAEHEGVDFKIGCDAYGLLRPDKFVAYFASRGQLDVVAEALCRRLAGMPAHGVPFTAGIDDQGMLSWGVDPPDGARALRWLDRESWRFWMTTKLGNALAIAKRSSSHGSMDSWRFALARVRRLGVDVDHWTPADGLWRAA